MRSEVGETIARRLVMEYVSACNSHDVARLAALFVEDGSYGDFGEGKVFLERDEVERYFSTFFSALPDLTLTLTAEPSHDGERALCKWTMSGTQTGPIMGLSATGRSFQVEGSTALMIRGEQIERAAAYYSTRSVVRQLKDGLAPEAAARPPVPPANGLVVPPEFPTDEDNIGYGE
jgi:steroid delta-isomerase-like uncharacterized protein